MADTRRHCRIEYRSRGLGGAGHRGIDVTVEQVVDTDLLKVGVAVGHGDQGKSLCQCDERRASLGEHLDVVAHLVEDRKCLFHDKI